MAFVFSCSDNEEVTVSNEAENNQGEIIEIDLDEHPEMILAEYHSDNKEVEMKLIETYPGSILAFFKFGPNSTGNDRAKYTSLLNEVDANMKSFSDLYKEIAKEKIKDVHVKAIKEATTRFKEREGKITNGLFQIAHPSGKGLVSNEHYDLNKVPNDPNSGCNSIPSTVSYFTNELCNKNSHTNSIQFTMPAGNVVSYCGTNRIGAFEPPSNSFEFTDFYRVWGLSGNANRSFRITLTYKTNYYGATQSISAVVGPGYWGMYHAFGRAYRTSSVREILPANQSYCYIHYAALRRYPLILAKTDN